MTAPPPTSPPGESPAAAPASAAPGPPPRSRIRRLLWGLVGLVVVVAAAVGVILFLTRGDGTKVTANPIEVRRLVATFPCTPANPTTPENIRLTAGQEVVKVPRVGCAVVGEVLGRVDRLTSVEQTAGEGDCTVTLEAPEQYGRLLDAASDVSDGQVRAVVAGGWVIDVRAVLDYPGRPAAPLRIAFTSPDPVACTEVAAAVALR